MTKALLFATDEIDACTDIERLRTLAKQYRNAMIGQHEWAGHALGVDDSDGCEKCATARDTCDPADACDRYKAWQAEYEAALAAPILPAGGA